MAELLDATIGLYLDDGDRGRLVTEHARAVSDLPPHLLDSVVRKECKQADRPGG